MPQVQEPKGGAAVGGFLRHHFEEELSQSGLFLWLRLESMLARLWRPSSGDSFSDSQFINWHPPRGPQP